MPKLARFAAIAAAATALSAATPALAAPVTVNLRVEGGQTWFEGAVVTDAKTINGHPCDGTPNHPGTTPGPTATGALDDASQTGAFTWDGTWGSGGYPDYLVTRIGTDDTDTVNWSTPSWALLVNWVYTSEGGCNTRVGAGDDILWAYTDYTRPFLQLSGTPARAATGQAFDVTVHEHDGSGTRRAAAGAAVRDKVTDASGRASISFTDAGVYTFKATRIDSIRSNAQTVCVYVPGSGDCGTERANTDQPATTSDPQPPVPASQPAAAPKDTTPPTVRITSLTDGKTYNRGPRVLSGEADDAGGIAQVFLRLRATRGGDLTSSSRCRWFSHKRSVFTHRTVPCDRARFFRVGNASKFSYLLPARLRRGKYVLDVKVLDRSYNAGRSSVRFGVK